MKMKKYILIAAAVLGLTACQQKLEHIAFDPSQSTAPVLNEFSMSEDGDFSVAYTPAVLNVNNKLVSHNLAIVELDGKPVSKLLDGKDESHVITVKSAALNKALTALGCDGESTYDFKVVVRAAPVATPSDKASSSSYLDSQAKAEIKDYVLQISTTPGGSGDPYASYTEVSPWGLIGSFNSWGGDYEMWSNGTLHVAKAVELTAGAEVKFRRDASWDVNYGYASGVSSYVLGEEFAVGQDGSNIVIAEDGVYDFILDPAAGTAKIINTVAGGGDPYAAFTDLSPWGVIGSFNSWGGDYEMWTDGTLHVAKAFAIDAGAEIKFRRDASWDVNYGYASGVSSYTIGEEFAVGQDGSNIVITESGVFDLILDPDNATVKIIVSLVGEGGGDTPAPAPKPKAWSLIGTIGESNWDQDFDLTNTGGNTWTIANVHMAAGTEFKIRADHDWGISYGAAGSDAVVIGETFKAGSSNIVIAEENDYNVTFTYGDEPTILIEEYKEFPSSLYMIGAEFGNWNWSSDGVVELTPVLHNPSWGAEAEGQFWTVRYFTAGEGFKFCAVREWKGDFNALDENDGFQMDGGNCVVAEDGFYMVHVDLKASKLHVEPARVALIGDCTGLGGDAWNADVVSSSEATLFAPADKTLRLTIPASGNLRMFAASAIATSDWWTREFNVYDGVIVCRGNGGDQDPVAVSAGQVVTLDFNAGTASISE